MGVQRHHSLFICLFVYLASGVSCSKSDTAAATAASGVGVAAAFPSGLALSSPTASQSASLMSMGDVGTFTVDSCESGTASFTVTPTGGTARAADTTTMDLVDVSTIATTITAPTAPTAPTETD